MKEKVSYALLIISSITVIYMLFFAGNTMRLSDVIITEEQFCQITQNRQLSEEVLLEGLLFNEESLFFDMADRTFYYSLIEEDSNVSDPCVNIYTSQEGVDVSIVGEGITESVIRKNKELKIVAYNDMFYEEYSLKCTTLPLMNLNCDSEIGIDEVMMDVTLFDNRKGATQRYTTSEGTVRLRGATTMGYPKKSFRLSLIQDSLGDNLRSNKISLLGMRQDEDWILYPAYNDQEKIRNVFSTNLWKYTCANDNSLGIDNGTEYKYLELFVNNEYWGLYALAYPIDELQLEIDWEKDEQLYKKIAWDVEADTISRLTPLVPGYSVTESERDEWQPLKNYYSTLHAEWDNSQEMYKGIDINNAINMYLFINLIQGEDHAGAFDIMSIKNMYLSLKQYNGRDVLLYTPWDLDISWGNQWTGNSATNLTRPYGISPNENIVMEHGNLQALIANQDEDIWNRILGKYWSLREGMWSEEYINEMLDEYEADIYHSGAYLREMERWPEGSYADVEDGLNTFRAYVMERLQEADKYYTRIEELSSKSVFVVRSAKYQDFTKQDFILELNDKERFENQNYKEFMEYIGVDVKEVPKDTRFVLINGENQEIDYLQVNGDVSADTCVGKIDIVQNVDDCNQYRVFLNGLEWYTTEAIPLNDIQMRFMTSRGVTTFDFTEKFQMWSYYIEQDDAEEWCEIIRDNRYNVVIEILNPEVVYEDNFVSLAQGFGIEEDELSEDTDFIVVKEGMGATVLDNNHESGDRGETVLGTLGVFYNEEGGYGVYLNGEECILASIEENHNVDARVVVYEDSPYDALWTKDALY